MKMAEKCSLSTIAYVSWMICLNEFDISNASKISSDLKINELDYEWKNNVTKIKCNAMEEFNDGIANKISTPKHHYFQKLNNFLFIPEKKNRSWKIIINDRTNKKMKSENKSINLQGKEDQQTGQIFNNYYDSNNLIRNVRLIDLMKNSLIFNQLKHKDNGHDSGRLVNNDNKCISQRGISNVMNMDVVKSAKFNANNIMPDKEIIKNFNNYRPAQKRIVSGSKTVLKSLNDINSASHFTIISSKINQNGCKLNTTNNSQVSLNGERYVRSLSENREIIPNLNKKTISGGKNKIKIKKYNKKSKRFNKKQKHIKPFYFKTNRIERLSNMPYSNSKKIKMSNISKKFKNSRRKNRNKIINTSKDLYKLSSKISFKNIQEIIDSKVTKDTIKGKQTTLDFYAALLNIAKNVKNSTESGIVKKKKGCPILTPKDDDSDDDFDEDDDDLEVSENNVQAFYQTCTDFNNNNNNTYLYYTKAISDENNLNNIIIINIRTFSVSTLETHTCPANFFAPTWSTAKYPDYRLLKDDFVLENNIVTAALFTTSVFILVVTCCVTPMVFFKKKQTIVENIQEDTCSQESDNS